MCDNSQMAVIERTKDEWQNSERQQVGVSYLLAHRYAHHAYHYNHKPNHKEKMAHM